MKPRKHEIKDEIDGIILKFIVFLRNEFRIISISINKFRFLEFSWLSASVVTD